MDFGKVDNPESVHFVLPPDDPRSASTLAHRSAAVRAPRVYLGAPVWSCPKWVGKVFPPKTPARDYLGHYARRFNAIELNSTFYRVPELKTVQAWCDATPQTFRFSPKVQQQISHSASLGAGTQALAQTCRAFAAFAGRLGPCFLQLPPGFSPAKLRALEGFLRAWPFELALAVEFRHPAWFERGRLRAEAFELLAQRGVSAVMTDTAGRRDVLHASLTSRRAFVRFVGNELHASDFSRLDDWAGRLGAWLEAGVDEVYFYLHQPTYVNVPELCDHFVRAMNARWHLGLPEPRQLEDQLKLL